MVSTKPARDVARCATNAGEISTDQVQSRPQNPASGITLKLSRKYALASVPSTCDDIVRQQNTCLNCAGEVPSERPIRCIFTKILYTHDMKGKVGVSETVVARYIRHALLLS